MTTVTNDVNNQTTEPTTTPGLDWSGRRGAPLATVGPLAPCVHCTRPAWLRHPVTHEPCHKVCEERALGAKAPTMAGEAA